ncbi:hypothetical protein BS47DRAFT_1394049 [Hydnum rufescens UP504]|uniref:Uncharacterized protein n=1 Tax=Hydnum rufescens UP504 TaxID=1448309 RepID=A0A9P6AV98_9AGAM|nr:hypothetical protein BS47DRAFT_1394049 [Hydnum rufescens UP504]
MSFLYGNHIVNAHLGRMLKDIPEDQGVVACSGFGGFGVIARSTVDTQKLHHGHFGVVSSAYSPSSPPSESPRNAHDSTQIRHDTHDLSMRGNIHKKLRGPRHAVLMIVTWILYNPVHDEIKNYIVRPWYMARDLLPGK